MKQGLIRTQDNAAIQARYDAELVSVADEPSTKTRRELDQLGIWNACTKQEADAAPEDVAVPVWVTLEKVRSEPVDPQNPLGWLYAARARDGKS